MDAQKSMDRPSLVALWIAEDKIGLSQGTVLEVSEWFRVARPSDFDRYWDLLSPARVELYVVAELLAPFIENLDLGTLPDPPEMVTPSDSYEPVEHLEAAQRLLSNGEIAIVGCEALSGELRERVARHCAMARDAIDATLVSLRKDLTNERH